MRYVIKRIVLIVELDILYLVVCVHKANTSYASVLKRGKNMCLGKFLRKRIKLKVMRHFLHYQWSGPF
jgi:hypothetical protein